LGQNELVGDHQVIQNLVKTFFDFARRAEEATDEQARQHVVFCLILEDALELLR